MNDHPSNASYAIDMLSAYRLGRHEQLEQVTKWLDENLNRSYYLRPVGLHSYEIDTLDVIEDLKEAMPAQEDK